ncbi:hypothetical protein STEG23_017578, partial [Scotinomys teguina]
TSGAPIVPQLSREAYVTTLHPCEIVTGFILCKSYAGSHIGHDLAGIPRMQISQVIIHAAVGSSVMKLHLNHKCFCQAIHVSRLGSSLLASFFGA